MSIISWTIRLGGLLFFLDLIGQGLQNTEPFLPGSFRARASLPMFLSNKSFSSLKPRFLFLVYPLQDPGVATRATAAGLKAAPTVRSPAKIFRAGEAAPVRIRRSPARATDPGRATTPSACG